MTATFVSTSIPYVNAPPHVGFALELVQADVIARRRRQRGEDVFFLSGTDENALKNVQVAEELGITPAQLCDRNAPRFGELIRALHISTDGFIRTSSDQHHLGVQKLWQACRPEDFARRSYDGLYCTGCEDFYLERDLLDGKCPIHGSSPDRVSEENHFFSLPAYQEQLEDELSSGALRVVPEGRRNEALAFVRQGLRDLSVSREGTRGGGWGVPVPDDPDQTVYVWFDALANYLTGLGYGGDEGGVQRYWLESQDRVHVIGKDILRFHAVYWPAFLASAGLPLPTNIAVHGFLTVDGEKISKSRANAVDPFPIIQRYGPDALRYYLLRSVRPGEDGDFSEQRLRETYTAHLANGLGNLVRRVEALCDRAGCGGGEAPPTEAPVEAADALDQYQFSRALELIWERVAALNRDLEQHRPWDLLRDGDRPQVSQLLDGWVDQLRAIGKGLEPLLPETSRKIADSLSRERISPGEALFPRLA